MIRHYTKHVLPRFTVGLAALLIRLLGASVRLRLEDPHRVLEGLRTRPVIFAFWHNRILLMPYFYEKLCKGRRLTMLMSHSRDGQFISEVAGRFGIDSARGSTSRGAIGGLLQMCRLPGRENRDLGITPDGPRGPRGQAKPGVLLLSEASGLPIVAVSYELSAKWELRSWDRFQIPKPFARCILKLGRPLTPSGDAGADAARLTALLDGEDPLI